MWKALFHLFGSHPQTIHNRWHRPHPAGKKCENPNFIPHMLLFCFCVIYIYNVSLRDGSTPVSAMGGAKCTASKKKKKENLTLFLEGAIMPKNTCMGARNEGRGRPQKQWGFSKWFVKSRRTLSVYLFSSLFFFGVESKSRIGTEKEK